jgi:hypothetical protein
MKRSERPKGLIKRKARKEKEMIKQKEDDMTKRLMSSPKCRSVEVINNPARPGSNYKEVNCINYK